MILSVLLKTHSHDVHGLVVILQELLGVLHHVDARCLVRCETGKIPKGLFVDLKVRMKRAVDYVVIDVIILIEEILGGNWVFFIAGLTIFMVFALIVDILRYFRNL